MKLIMNSIYGFFGAPGDFATCPQARGLGHHGERATVHLRRHMCLAMTAGKLLEHRTGPPGGAGSPNRGDGAPGFGLEPGSEDRCRGRRHGLGLPALPSEAEMTSVAAPGRASAATAASTTGPCGPWGKFSRGGQQITFAPSLDDPRDGEVFFDRGRDCGKKKYIGRVHYDDSGKSKVGGKGTLVVRGDTIGLVKMVYEQLCDVLLDPRFERLQAPVEEDALAVAHQAFEDMLEGKFPGEPYTQRKKLSRAPHKYKRTPLKDGGGFRPPPQWVQVGGADPRTHGEAGRGRLLRPLAGDAQRPWRAGLRGLGMTGSRRPNTKRRPSGHGAVHVPRGDCGGELLSFLGPDVFRF